MSEPVKAADVIDRIFAGLKKWEEETGNNVNTVNPRTLQELIGDLACPADCPCGKSNA